jgi:hypothetical protein
VFPDGELPHLALVLREMPAAGLEVSDVESLRRRYDARTANDWASRLESNRERAFSDGRAENPGPHPPLTRECVYQQEGGKPPPTSSAALSGACRRVRQLAGFSGSKRSDSRLTTA